MADRRLDFPPRAVREPGVLEAASVDQGRLVRHVPEAVVAARCPSDVEDAVRFCAANRVALAPRGTAHTLFGQCLVPGGVVVDTTGLSGVLALNDTSVVVEAGVLWRDLVRELDARGLRLASGLTGYLGLTVGGVLSVGGFTSAYRSGAVVDNVLSIDVVTGTGETRTCTPHQDRELFDTALAGLGQVGVITRARLGVRPRPATVRTFLLDYAHPARFFTDLRLLLRRSEADEMFCMVLPPTGSAPPTYRLHVYSHAPSDDVIRGMSPDGSTSVDSTWWESISFYDAMMESALAQGWAEQHKPWFDVLLPARTAEAYITDTIAGLDPSDWSQPGFVLVLPQRAGALRRPALRVPDDEWVILFDILNSLPTGTDARSTLDRNIHLHNKAMVYGGVRYPIGALPFTQAQWCAHYGPHWPTLVAAKRRYDPHGILTPGPGMFTTLPRQGNRGT